MFVMPPSSPTQALFDRTLPGLWPDAPAALSASTFSDLCDVLGIAHGRHIEWSMQLSRQRVGAGCSLYQTGEPFRQFYVVRSGFMKSITTDPSGNERVVGFSLRGGLLGLDGLAYGRHMASAVALADAELIVLPLATLHAAGRNYPDFASSVYSAMSIELARTLAATGRLGLTTRSRIARLLLDMADRFAALGYSPSRFNLPMSRSDIASYLGMAKATVSRSLLELETLGLIRQDQRSIQILDRQGLRRLKRMPRLIDDTFAK
ncbi:helix-turn-helix domain-containing protein [Duganella sp. FT134W]|uniref:Helix-turn-helix domain-containing protein n=1 Tax=Duganella margarita TaxID=2692170 RepID=A0A7X4KHT5_9BURK|nr:Crp/Fnr family transcriptional regulator [Duganella margarita]MYM73974.1 helix-turn-helix domain-containing protein [Duganella margarita]